MTVHLHQGIISLIGPCGVEDVETLVTYLDGQPGLSVDLSGATSLHTALWQTLMVFKPAISAGPAPTSAMDGAFQALRAFHPPESA